MKQRLIRRLARFLKPYGWRLAGLVVLLVAILPTVYLVLRKLLKLVLQRAKLLFPKSKVTLPILLKTTTVIHSQFITKLMATKHLNQFMVQSQSLRKVTTLKVVLLLLLVQSLLKNSFNSAMMPQLRTTC